MLKLVSSAILNSRVFIRSPAWTSQFPTLPTRWLFLSFCSRHTPLPTRWLFLSFCSRHTPLPRRWLLLSFALVSPPALCQLPAVRSHLKDQQMPGLHTFHMRVAYQRPLRPVIHQAVYQRPLWPVIHQAGWVCLQFMYN